MPQLQKHIKGANLIESLEVGPAQGNAALLALNVLHLIVTSGQVSHRHLASPVGQHMFTHHANLKIDIHITQAVQTRAARCRLVASSDLGNVGGCCCAVKLMTEVACDKLQAAYQSHGLYSRSSPPCSIDSGTKQHSRLVAPAHLAVAPHDSLG